MNASEQQEGQISTWEDGARSALCILTAEDFGRDDNLLGWIDAHVASANFEGVQLEASAALANLGRPVDPDDMVALLASKQRDYGHENILRYGEDGVKVRISDKVCRLRNLLSRGIEASHESIEDSWLDIVGYGVIGVMLQRGTFDLLLAADTHTVERKIRVWSEYNGQIGPISYWGIDQFEGNYWAGHVTTLLGAPDAEIGIEVVINFPGGDWSSYKLVEIIDGVDVEREADQF